MMLMVAAVIGLCAFGILLWHMQKPKPRRIAVSFARFIPALPPAPVDRTRLALARPRDLLPLALLMAAAALAILALVQAQRQYLAQRPDHIGLRIVFDRSHSMSVRDASASRSDLALARAAVAQARLAGLGAGSDCVELIGVAARTGQPQVQSLAADLSPILVAPLPEGGEAFRLLEAATMPTGNCPLSHVLVLTDLPPPGALPQQGPQLIWDQLGAPVENHGLRGLALVTGAFGQERFEIRIDGLSSGQGTPGALRLEGPGGAQNLTITTDPDATGRWSAFGLYRGPGLYTAQLTAADGYVGDDRIEAQLDRPAALEADWQLSELPRPEALTAAGAPAPLIAATGSAGQLDPGRPVLLTYPGFPGGGGDRRLGPFLEDPLLLGALNFDALEAALPLPWPGPLPPGFQPVLTDADGGVLIARRDEPPGLILPAPAPRLSEPERSLSLTLFFSGLADLLATKAEPQPVRWRSPAGEEVAEAWRETLTARPLAAAAALDNFSPAAAPLAGTPLWPWLVLAALALIFCERALRLLRRSERLL